jgi:hypothetical protein
MPIPTYDELEAEIQRLRAENLNCDWDTIKKKDAAIKRYVQTGRKPVRSRIWSSYETMC